ncbi:GNAT family N-acetyltransferase [Pseudoclavibacter sp. RFBA6]|uniref:GNAT family N-acetyltransferase n=1 Tax=Pseudoclavibacter sp. RFBA6 TaxID=2080573 RepID=UPI000CE89D37|nr:GNAT family N-acetyltransferase [Pseudoclavibacter sp. RFBA6]PPG39486.1 hypothetical protein C5C17_11895 [Pseudoclavibacter sp. RFBA6]
MRLAQSLVQKGYTWQQMEAGDRSHLQVRCRARLAGSASFTIADHDGGIVCVDSSGKIAGGLVFMAANFPEGSVSVHVRALVVEPTHERRGVATVTLNMLPQVLDGYGVRATNGATRLAYGGCEPSAAVLYRKAGYEVSRPGAPLTLEVGTGASVTSDNPVYSCWFKRAI